MKKENKILKTCQIKSLNRLKQFSSTHKFELPQSVNEFNECNIVNISCENKQGKGCSFCSEKISLTSKAALIKEDIDKYLLITDKVFLKDHVEKYNLISEKEKNNVQRKIIDNLDKNKINVEKFKNSDSYLPFPGLQSSIDEQASLQYQSYFVLCSQIISENLCINCGMCSKVCPTNAIKVKDKTPYFDGHCKEGSCGLCVISCPVMSFTSDEINKQIYIESFNSKMVVLIDKHEIDQILRK